MTGLTDRRNMTGVGGASGTARILPDNVNTDYIISSRRKRDASGPAELVPFIFEDLLPPLSHPIQAGDIIVAGWNFGCGSAMEIAAEVLKAAGVKALVARSVARTFYRNAVNLGLPVLELAEQAPGAGVGTAVPGAAAWCVEGDRLAVAFEVSTMDRDTPAGVRNVTQGTFVPCLPPSRFAVELVRHGGLIPYYLGVKEIPRGII